MHPYGVLPFLCPLAGGNANSPWPEIKQPFKAPQCNVISAAAHGMLFIFPLRCALCGTWKSGYKSTRLSWAMSRSQQSCAKHSDSKHSRVCFNKSNRNVQNLTTWHFPSSAAERERLQRKYLEALGLELLLECQPTHSTWRSSNLLRVMKYTSLTKQPSRARCSI